MATDYDLWMKAHHITPIVFWSKPSEYYLPMKDFNRLIGLPHQCEDWLTRDEFRSYVKQVDIVQVKRHRKMVIRLKAAYGGQVASFYFGRKSA